MTEPRRLSAEYFDQWYSNMLGEGPGDALKRKHLGLPPHFLSSSLLPWEGIAEVAGALRLRPGDRLLDLACGRGGYGLEIAKRTGASLTGVDFSSEAIAQAAALARQVGTDAVFRVGDLADTGLPAASAEAVVCVDSIQFKSGDASFREMHRVLAPGGRVALTAWEALDPSDERVPALIRGVDLRTALERAGFVDVEVRDCPQWRPAERGLWEEAAELDPGDSPALRSLHNEAVRTLPIYDLTRRILASASTSPRTSTSTSTSTSTA